jgi:hypothetical protein
MRCSQIHPFTAFLRIERHRVFAEMHHNANHLSVRAWHSPGMQPQGMGGRQQKIG